MKNISTVLNLVSDNKHFVEHFLLNKEYESIIFRKCDIAYCLKANKCGKAGSVDRLAAEYFF